MFQRFENWLFTDLHKKVAFLAFLTALASVYEYKALALVGAFAISLGSAFELFRLLRPKFAKATSTN